MQRYILKDATCGIAGATYMPPAVHITSRRAR